MPPTTHFDPWESLWYFLWLPLVIAVLCYLLAVHLASPLRNLRKVVERFGRGELGARSELSRKDEIGELARAFNLMAGQITTLLSAERRLLQDVSHELRSPLARLGFAVELAKTSPDRETSTGPHSPGGRPAGDIWSTSCFSSREPKATRPRGYLRRGRSA